MEGKPGCETFLIQSNDQDFCKTRRKPYDQAICEILLVLQTMIPGFTFTSDGINPNKELDESWSAAMKEVHRYEITAARVRETAKIQTTIFLDNPVNGLEE